VKVHDGQSGYLSQSIYPLYFGLGEAKAVDQIEVVWPSGQRQVLAGPIPANQLLKIKESEPLDVDDPTRNGVTSPRGTFLDEIEQRREVTIGIIRAEVEFGLNEARRKMGSDPALVREDLKLLLKAVALTSDVPAEVKERLRDKIVAALQDVNRRLTEED
jgi:hypothetical protein